MKSLAELEEESVYNQFVDDAVARTRQSAGVATAQQGFGGNTGVEGREGDVAMNVDVWFANARWN